MSDLKKIYEYLRILDIPQNQELPKLKAIQRNYLRLCIERHPDKNGGVDKEFNEFHDAFENLSKYVF